MIVELTKMLFSNDGSVRSKKFAVETDNISYVIEHDDVHTFVRMTDGSDHIVLGAFDEVLKLLRGDG